jgi:hypothetical protein
MATLFLIVCVLAGLLVPGRPARHAAEREPRLTRVAEPADA